MKSVTFARSRLQRGEVGDAVADGNRTDVREKVPMSYVIATGHLRVFSRLFPILGHRFAARIASASEQPLIVCGGIGSGFIDTAPPANG